MNRYTMHANGGVRPIESDTGEWIKFTDRSKGLTLEINGVKIAFELVEFMTGDVKIVAVYHDQPGFAL